MSDVLIDEVAARRPDWVEGEWILLADGQRWSFPRLRGRLLMAPNPEVQWTVGGHPDPDTGEAFRAAHELLLSEQATAVDMMNLTAHLATLLLLRNYRIDAIEALHLLVGGFEGRPGASDLIHRTMTEVEERVIRQVREDVGRIRAGMPPVVAKRPVIGLN